MIYKSFSDTELFEGKTNKTYEYHILDKDINYCICDINGILPVKNWVVNRKCKEMAHVLSGSGILNVDGVIYNLKKMMLF